MQIVKSKWIAIAAAALLGLSALSARTANAQEATSTPSGDPGTISVTGMGSAWGEPDVAYVDLGVETVDTDLSTAFSSANTQMNALIDAIVGFGIAREDIQTTTLSVYQEDIYDPNSGQPTGEQRYHVQNFIRVTLRDTTQIGDFVSMAVESGANRLLSLSFGILDTAALEQSARSSAVDDARSRAEQLAALMGMQLGRPLSVSETLSGGAPIPLGSGGISRMAMDSAPVQGGQLEVDVQINVTFELIGQ
ncbi:MAG: SIMPL domain-containing protein [Anaerolineae bacterium]